MNAEALLSALAEADNKVATKSGELKAAKEEYDALADRVIGMLDEQGLSEMGAPKAGLKVSVAETDAYGISDWDAFTKFVLRHKAVEMFYRRLSSKAVEAMIEKRKGLAVPGVNVYKQRRLHVTRPKGKQK